jgi:uncharacterized protein involved in exopolysaccharide biosynthesis
MMREMRKSEAVSVAGAPRVLLPAEPEAVKLSDIVRHVRRHILTIVLCIAASVAMASYYLARVTPAYLARAQILIDPKFPQLLREQPSELVVSLDNAQIESQMVVLRSEKLASAVIDKLKLADRPEFKQPGPGWLNQMGQKIGLLSAPPSASEFDHDRFVVNQFTSDLDVRRTGLSYAVDISYTSSNPALASDIVNAVTEAYISDQLEAKSRATRQGGEWLEQRIASIRGKLNSAVIALQNARASHDYRLPSVRGDTSVGNTVEELEATSQTYAKLYDSALQAYTNAVLSQSYPVADARVITAASRPLGPIWPKPSLILSLAVLLGLSIGIVIAAVFSIRERADA